MNISEYHASHTCIHSSRGTVDTLHLSDRPSLQPTTYFITHTRPDSHQTTHEMVPACPKKELENSILRFVIKESGKITVITFFCPVNQEVSHEQTRRVFPYFEERKKRPIFSERRNECGKGFEDTRNKGDFLVCVCVIQIPTQTPGESRPLEKRRSKMFFFFFKLTSSERLIEQCFYFF